MYEVECPRCAHPYDVDDAAREATCPACGLAVDLVDEEAAQPASGLHDDEAFVEVPCPLCTGPLLLSDADAEGLCPHCEAPLTFDHGTPHPLESKRGDAASPEASAPRERTVTAPPPATEASPARETVVPDEPIDPVAPPPQAPLLRYDPDLRVTRETAPLVETRPVRPRSAETPPVAREPREGTGPDVPPAKTPGPRSEVLQADAPHPEATPAPPPAAGPSPATEASPARETVVPDEPVATVNPPATGPPPRFDPTLTVTRENAPLVSCAAGAGPRPDDPGAVGGSGGGVSASRAPADEPKEESGSSLRGRGKTTRTGGTRVSRRGTKAGRGAERDDVAEATTAGRS